jgi:predicted HNH restriction endonuclease
MINKQKLNDCITEYRNHCKNSKWTTDELYKFEFANWLNHKLNITKHEIPEIYEICLQSQQQNFGGRKGIQFNKNGAEKLSEIITISDAAIIQYLSKNDYSLETFENRVISFNVLSAWLGTILPNKFVCVPTIDFVHSISFLFNLNIQEIPKLGFEYFEFGQEYLKIMKDELKQLDFKNIYLPEINKYRKSIGNRNNEKSDYEEYEWNWIVEDFNLFIHRIYLKAHQEKIRKRIKENNHIENNQNTNKLKVSNNQENTTITTKMRNSIDESIIDDTHKKNSTEDIKEQIDSECFDTLGDISDLDEKYKNATLEIKEYLSKKIERGSFAEKIKKVNNYKCSICVKMNQPAHTFKMKNGDNYVEAHHVFPVSELQMGSLSSANIIVVCPNHHRQIHFGNTEIIEINEFRILFKMDSKLIPVSKTKIM